MADDAPLYEVELTDEAFYAYATLSPERLFRHVDNELDLLRHFPELGEAYDPAYPASRPPFPCRVLYCEHLGIYYRIDEGSRKVIVIALEDQRRNPLNRFG